MDDEKMAIALFLASNEKKDTFFCTTFRVEGNKYSYFFHLSSND